MFDLRERAAEVISAWNDHDLDRFVAMHAPNLEYSSPYVRKVIAGSNGTLRGMESIRPIWEKALSTYPDIHSTIVSICVGIDSAAVQYTSTAKDGLIVDVMRFDGDGLVCRLDVFHA